MEPSKRVVIVRSVSPVVAIGLGVMVIAFMAVSIAQIDFHELEELTTVSVDGTSFSFDAHVSGPIDFFKLVFGPSFLLAFGRTVLVAAGVLKPMVGRVTKGAPVLEVRSGILQSKKRLRLTRGSTLTIDRVRETLSSSGARDALTLAELLLRTPAQTVSCHMYGPFDEARHAALAEWCSSHGIRLDPAPGAELPLVLKGAEEEMAEGRARIERQITQVFLPEGDGAAPRGTAPSP